MKLSRWCVLILAVSSSCVALAAPAGKEKEADGKKVDSGSFGVFMNGRRVGTETFSITQTASGSVIQSEFKADGDSGQAVQDSELQLTSGGEIRRYEWKEQSPGKARSVVIPNDQFLTQKYSAGPQDKEQEQPYLLPVSTNILDDYFFVHREVLAWKYLGSTCKSEKGQVQCPVKQRAQFGTMNPHQHSSAPASMEFLGREKMMVGKVEKEMSKLELKSETGSWLIWFDDDFKVLRISIPAEKTEVIRD
ncbi:MAG: hypothetical protein HY010_09500 [Acidobacteria bacterium]|nr:hypothetical protein [Acidobacteriota bacterium]